MRSVQELSLAALLIMAFLVILPAPAMAAGAYPSVANGGAHALAIKTDGSLWAWGNNEFGQLGGGTKEKKTTPDKVMDNVAAVAAGSRHTLALKTDGTLWAWGYNHYGQLGNGSTIDSSTPVQMLTDVAFVTAGENHSLAIKTDGTLWAWGFNTNGQLGDGTTAKKTEPVKVLDNVAFVTAGTQHTLAIKQDGSLWAWGANNYGQIGNDTTARQTRPVKVLDEVAYAALDDENSLAVNWDGTLWMWGNNENGQIGDGTGNTRFKPVKVLEGVAYALTDEGTSFALKTDGSLWAWGDNFLGQLGDGTLASRYKPVQILNQVLYTYPGAAIQADNGLMAWGHSNTAFLRWVFDEQGHKELENEDTVLRYADPAKALDNVAAVAPGNEYVLAVRKDGALMAWGSQAQGMMEMDLPMGGSASLWRGQTGLTSGGMIRGSSAKKVLSDVQVPPGILPFVLAPIPDSMPEPPDEPVLDPIAGLESASVWAAESLSQAIAARLVPASLQGDYTANISRAEFCGLVMAFIEAKSGQTMAAYASGRGLVMDMEAFSDTRDEAVLYAYALDIVRGVGDRLFDPAGPITREQAATMLTRLQTLLGADSSGIADAQFSDGAKISPWAIAGVDYVFAKGIMNGIGGNMFDPQGSYTREQAIVTFWRMLGQ